MVVKFTDVKKSAYSKKSYIKDGYTRVSVRDLIGDKVIITNVEKVDGLYGKAYVCYLKDGRAFMTSSNVLIDQIDNVIKPAIDKGEEVETTLAWAIGRSGRKYMTFS